MVIGFRVKHNTRIRNISCTHLSLFPKVADPVWPCTCLTWTYVIYRKLIRGLRSKTNKQTNRTITILFFCRPCFGLKAVGRRSSVWLTVWHFAWQYFCPSVSLPFKMLFFFLLLRSLYRPSSISFLYPYYFCHQPVLGNECRNIERVVNDRGEVLLWATHSACKRHEWTVA